MTELTLSPDQSGALDSFVQFLMNPGIPVWVLRGYSGTGKSTLVHTLMENLEGYLDAARLLSEDFPDYDVALTATTNKAAETFSLITGREVKTIHSYLSLRVDKDYATGQSRLVAGRNAEIKYEKLLFIDEASMIDHQLLGLIFKQTKDCKIVFIGDPAQLPPVKSQTTPVFDAGFPEARLTQVMRQMVDGKPCVNPITELSTAFRLTVETGQWPTGFKPDGKYVEWVDREEFTRRIEAEFTRDDWMYRDSKVLAWTNNTVIAYNKHIRALRSGEPTIQPGDYVENNSFVMIGKHGIKTDQTVYISEIEEDIELHGVLGNYIVIDNVCRAFHPKSRDAKNKLLARVRAAEDFALGREVENWVDLRPVFSQTINKSQGSTYDQVFVDLDDIKKCTNGNLIARLMYVGLSRARIKVTMTGDLV